MFTFGSAASKDDGINGNTLGGLPGWVHDGALASRGTEARVGMCTGLLVTWQRKYKFHHFQGHVYDQHIHTFVCTLAHLFLPYQFPAISCVKEQGERSQDISSKRLSYLLRMVLPAELCEERVGEELEFSKILMCMPSYNHLALTSAQGNRVHTGIRL